MKFILVLLISLSNALAQDGQWVLSSSKGESANTNPEMKQLLDKYSFLFDYVDPTHVSRVSVNTYIYQWFGETTCHLDDSRLWNTAYGYGVCYFSSQWGERCQYASPIIPEGNDPCKP